ncbi:MAG: hypothetical protein ABIK65_00170 [Candidatus Eisenbacteria bacterium]
MATRWTALGVVAVLAFMAVWYFAIRVPAPKIAENEIPFVLPVFPVGLQEGVPDEIRWRPVPGATGYDVEILDEGKRGIWKGKTSAAFIPFPEKVREPFLARTMLYYRIRAKGGMGKELAVSEPILLRLSAHAAGAAAGVGAE